MKNVDVAFQLDTLMSVNKLKAEKLNPILPGEHRAYNYRVKLAAALKQAREYAMALAMLDSEG